MTSPETCPHEMIYVTSSTMVPRPPVKCHLPKGHEGRHEGDVGTGTTTIKWPPLDAA